jgi:Virus neck protein
VALNPYFNKFKNLPEQNLIEDLTIEAIKMYGMEMYYLPRTMIRKDDFFGESPYSRFSSFRMIEMYMDTTTAFEGGDTFTKFGFEVRDSVKFTVSRKRFKRETTMERPLEGDLLYLPLNRGLFEIKFVEHENPFYQLGKLISFQLTCELFQYSEEKMDTGIPEIDVVEEEAGYSIALSLGVTGGTGTFTKGDYVYQYSNGSVTGSVESANASATVLSYNNSSPNSIVLTDLRGKWFTSTEAEMNVWITKNDNTAYRTVVGVDDKFGAYIDNSNKKIQDEAETYLNFDEQHPFGEV